MMSPDASGSAFFRVIASPRVSLGLLAMTAAVLSIGLFVPQRVPLEVIALTYPPRFAQVIGALDLHRVATGWLLQLSVVLLALNGVAALLYGLLRAGAPGERTPAPPGRATATTRGGDDRPVGEALSVALAGWSVTRLDADHLHARRGFQLASTLVVVIGLVVCAVGLFVSETAGTRGEVRLMIGDPGAETVRSRFRATRMEGDALVPWDPGFEVGCRHSPDGAFDSERVCRVMSGKDAYEAKVKPGRDIEFGGYQLSMVGFRRIPEAAGFELQVNQGKREHRVTAWPVSAVDVSDADGRLATLVVTGSAEGETVGVLPGGRLTGAVDVVARARTELVFRLSTDEHEPWVMAGGALVMLGLMLGFLLPSYHLSARRGAGKGIVIEVGSISLLGRPAEALRLLLPAIDGKASTT